MKSISSQLKVGAIVLVSVLLAACGSTPQGFVPLVKNNVQNQGTKIGFVYIAPDDKATTNIYGAGCLLCYGVASALTSSLDTHIESEISADELLVIKQAVIDGYGALDVSLQEITLAKPIAKMKKFDGENGFAKRDFRSLKQSKGLDMLVVLELNEHGAYRSFSNYVPNGDPQGYVSGTLYTVDLTTNGYIQYLKIDEKVQPQGNWDEPPTFPSVTTAYYQALENVKDSIKKSL